MADGVASAEPEGAGVIGAAALAAGAGATGGLAEATACHLRSKSRSPVGLIEDAKAVSAIACITPSSHLAQNLKLRRLYASGSASFPSTA